MKPPHPIPYQGSKRNLAPAILERIAGRTFDAIYEPFAGSAAFTIAAASRNIAQRFIVADSLAPLIEVWRQIVDHPGAIADAYAKVWGGNDSDTYFMEVRARFNRDHAAADLLYLLARCVKNSPRWNRDGLFNQSADKRRRGVRPEKMRREVLAASALLAGKATFVAADFEATIEDAGPDDLVYLDPPYQGTSIGRDARYHQGLSRDRLVAALQRLNLRGVPWLLSYDGRCGDKAYGAPLPLSVHAAQLELTAGRSSQATLNGRRAITVESLYISPALGVVVRPPATRVALRRATP